LTYRDKFDSSNSFGAIYGLNLNYLEEYELLNGSLSATLYKNIDSFSLIGGGSVGKMLTSWERV